MSELVQRSLLMRIPGEPTRFQLPDTVRLVALELGDPEIHTATRTRIAEIVLESAQAALFGTEPATELASAGGEIVPALRERHTSRCGVVYRL